MRDDGLRPNSIFKMNNKLIWIVRDFEVKFSIHFAQILLLEKHIFFSEEELTFLKLSRLFSSPMCTLLFSLLNLILFVLKLDILEF